MSEIVHEQCHFCGKIVQDRYMESDYHKGWHTVKRVDKYPFEERTFKFPEGQFYGVTICQDCNDKPDSKWIHKLRIEAVKKEVERAQKEATKRIETSERMAEEYWELMRVKHRVEEYLDELTENPEIETSWDEVKIPKELQL